MSSLSWTPRGQPASTSCNMCSHAAPSSAVSGGRVCSQPPDRPGFQPLPNLLMLAHKTCRRHTGRHVCLQTALLSIAPASGPVRIVLLPLYRCEGIVRPALLELMMTEMWLCSCSVPNVWHFISSFEWVVVVWRLGYYCLFLFIGVRDYF